MKKESKKLFLSIILFLLLVFIGFSQNETSGWTQFRGQSRGGISPEQISKSNFTQVWKQEIGSGFSEIIVSEERIYSMVSEKTDSVSGFEYIVCYDEKTAIEIWRSQVDSIFIDPDGWGDGPRSTPTLDENAIYSFSSFGKLTANSLKDGSQLWQLDFIKEFGSTTPRWGFSSSPLLINQNIIMEAGGIDSQAFIAIDKKTGKLVWAKGDGAASYNSPLLVTIDGQDQIIFANGTTLFSYNSNGDTLWTYQMPFGHMSAMPVFVAPNKIFVSTIRTTGFVFVEINSNIATEALKGNSMKNDFSSSCYHNGYIYGFHVAALRCISAETGEVKWTKRGLGKGSLILVNDKLFVLSDKGKLVISNAKPDAYEEINSIQAITGKSWTAPSFYDGKIYMRNLTQMACYELK